MTAIVNITTRHRRVPMLATDPLAPKTLNSAPAGHRHSIAPMISPKNLPAELRLFNDRIQESPIPKLVTVRGRLLSP